MPTDQLPSSTGDAAGPTTTPPSGPPLDARARRRRRSRRAAIIVAPLVVAALAAMLVLRSSWFIAGRVEAALSLQFGGPVSVEHAAYLGDGRFRVRGVVLRAPGIPGDAGRVAAISEAMIQMDEAALARLEPLPLKIEVDRIALRVAEDAEQPGRFAFASLRPDWSSESEAAAPEINVKQLMVEVGTFDGIRFDRRAERGFTALMRRVPGTEGDAGWHSVTLQELDADGIVDSERAIGVTGRVNARTLENTFALRSLQLDASTIDLLPTAARGLLEEMELAGAVRDVRVGWTPAGFSFDFDAENVSIVLPVEMGVAWTRYRAGTLEPVGTRPRLRVDSGRFAFDGGRLELTDLLGRVESSTGETTVVGVPYEIAFAIGERDTAGLAGVAAGGWTGDRIGTAPFELSLVTRDLEVGQADDPGVAIDVPQPVASVLEAFAFDRFSLTTELQVRRGPPSMGPAGLVPGPVVTAGQAIIEDATGRYQPFPYQLDDLRARLEFDEREVRINEVTGVGSGGAPVRIAGIIGNLGGSPSVALSLEADGVPIDARLRGAFDGDIGGVIDRLRDRQAVARLAAAGLLEGDGADEGGLGGTVDLRLSIDAAPDPDAIAVTRGLITLNDVDLVLDRFPYPMRVATGTVRLDRGRLDVVEPEGGLQVRTAGGGRGTLSGEVTWRGDEPVQPRLLLAVEDDRVTPSLLAAVPPSDAERASDPEGWNAWPGGRLARGGAWLDRLRLDGSLGYIARLTPASDGELDYEITVRLADATADAGAAIRVAADVPPGAPLQGDWGLRDVDGQVVVTPRGLRLEAIAGTTEGGRLELGGTVGLDEDARTVDLDVRATGLSVGDHVGDLITGTRRARLEPILTQHAPRGTVDLALLIHSDGYGDATVEGAITPRELSLDLDGVPMQFQSEGGEVGLSFGTAGGTELIFRDLAFRFSDPTDPGNDVDATLDRRRGATLHGRVLIDDDAAPVVDLEAEWEMARVRSPLMRQVLRWVGAAPQLERLDEVEAAGDLDLRVRYRSGRSRPSPREMLAGDSGEAGELGEAGGDRSLAGEPLMATGGGDWAIDLRPRTLAVMMQGVPIRIELDPGAEVRIEPGVIRLDRVAGGNDRLRATVDGVVRTADGIDALLEMSLEGMLLGEVGSALLPAAVRDVLQQLELSETRPTRVHDVQLVYRQPSAAGGEGEGEMDGDVARPDPTIDFTGTVELDAASLRAGIALGAVTGPFEITYGAGPRRPTELFVSATPTTLRLAGQTLTDLEATIRLDPDGRTLRLERLRGRSGPGTLVATAAFSTEPDGWYEVTADVAAMPLADFEFVAEPDATDAGEPPASAPASASAPAPMRPADEPPEVSARALAGEVHGTVRLAGRRGDPGSLVGRGRVLIREADLFAIPPVLGVLQAMQLTLPASNYDYAQANFFLAGRRVHFEELYLESSFAEQNAHSLVARGSFDLDTKRIDGRVRSRSGIFLPLREVVGAVGDAMAAIQLEGTLFDPRVRIELLAGDRSETQAVQARPRRPTGDDAAGPVAAGDRVTRAAMPPGD